MLMRSPGVTALTRSVIDNEIEASLIPTPKKSVWFASFPVPRPSYCVIKWNVEVISFFLLTCCRGGDGTGWGTGIE